MSLPNRVRWTRVVLAALLVSVPASRSHAQDTTGTANLKPTAAERVVQVVLRDGSTLLGRVIAVTPTSVRFASAVGESVIPRASISAVRAVSGTALHDGEYWPEDPSRTRLFFAPTGRMLRSSEYYFTDVYVFFPSIQAGVSDQVSFGIGASAFPGVPLDEQLYYITPKVGVYASPTVNVAVGALVAGAKSLSDASPAGIGYGVATFGGEDLNVTTGVGVGFVNSSSSSKFSTTLLMLGGTTRVSKSFALVTENYFTTGRQSGALFSGGFRFMSEHIAVDVAGVGTTGASVIVPYLAFIYRW